MRAALPRPVLFSRRLWGAPAESTCSRTFLGMGCTHAGGGAWRAESMGSSVVISEGDEERILHTYLQQNVFAWGVRVGGVG